MKLFSVFYDGNEISIHNTIWGVESVLYNGQKMTSEFSWWGTHHFFTVREDGYEVDYEVKVGFNMYGISANIYRNGDVIMKGLNDCKNFTRRKNNRSEFV